MKKSSFLNRFLIGDNIVGQTLPEATVQRQTIALVLLCTGGDWSKWYRLPQFERRMTNWPRLWWSFFAKWWWQNVMTGLRLQCWHKRVTGCWKQGGLVLWWFQRKESNDDNRTRHNPPILSSSTKHVCFAHPERGGFHLL